MNPNLTARQLEILRFLAEAEQVPTYREVCRGVGTKSIGHVKATIHKLCLLGYLKKAARKSRSFVVLQKGREEIERCKK